MIDAFRRMNGNRRFVLLAAIAGLAVVTLVLGRWATAPEFVPLYRGLDLSEAGQMTDQLDKAGIVFRLGDGGARVDVAVADAPKARVLLAKAGLPTQGRPGMELFDKPTWGMTDFTQRITYRRALEGELARTIGTLRGVERAQVHLALPEASPLRKLERPAEAAVVLTLRNDAAVTPGMVRGIALLVSSSVEGLSSDHVVVLDDQGELLAATSEEGDGIGLSGRQLELQRGVEQHLASKVTELLSAVTGSGKVRVQVAARLNFAQLEKTVEEYDPDKQVLANEQQSEGGAAEAGGAAPTITNNTYLNSRRIEKLVGEVGNITRLTVSVMVDSRGLEGNDPEGFRARLAELARNAVGIDSTRGDHLAVVSIPFGTVPVAVPATKTDLIPKGDGILVLVERLSRPALGLLAVLAAFALGWRALRPGKAGRQPAALGAGEPVPTLTPTPANIQLRNRIQADSLSAPDTAAKVVRAWLAEDA